MGSVFLMTKISENPVASPSSETGPLPFAGEQEVTSKKVIRPWGRGGVEVRTHLDQRHHTAEDRSWGAAAATRCCPARTGTGPCRAFRNPASRSRAGCKRFTLDTLGAVPSSAIHRSSKCESDDPNERRDGDAQRPHVRGTVTESRTRPASSMNWITDSFGVTCTRTNP